MATVDDEHVAVIVFAKPPRPGQAKTRLAATLGEAAAARLARAFVLDTWALVRSLAWAHPVVATTDIHDPFWRELGDLEIWPQGDGDLGERMARAARRALGTYGRVLLIGSDAPGLPATALVQARDALKYADAAIGPSDDGGYYLIGFRGACPSGVFDGVEWSTSHTRLRTRERLRELGLVVLSVMPWFDVDDVEDLQRLQLFGHRLRQTAPETARALETLERVP